MRLPPRPARLSARGRVLLGAAAASLLLSGCGGGGPGNSALPRDIAKIVDGYDCLAPNLGDWAPPPDSTPTPDPEHPDAPEPGRVPDGFTPTTAVRCDLMADLGDGEAFGVVAVTFEGDLAPLLAALAEPSDERAQGPCTADMELVPPLWLVDAAGRAINASYPVNGCGKTKPGVRDALAALPVLERTTLQRTELQPVPTPDGETLFPVLP